MTPLFIQLAHSVTGAVVSIVALLLVAVIIGYFTAWLYAKSVYTPVIKGLESEKADLIARVAGLNEEKAKLTSDVDKLGKKIVKLEQESAQKDKEIQLLSKSNK
jgi:hypothetical protein